MYDVCMYIPNNNCLEYFYCNLIHEIMKIYLEWPKIANSINQDLCLKNKLKNNKNKTRPWK